MGFETFETRSVIFDNLYPERRCILAGNSRLELDSNNLIKVEAQLHAFKAGLYLAANIRQRTGLLPPISIAFDHKGIFRKQFLRDGLSNSQKRNPRLSQLKDDAIKPYEAVAYETDISLEHIVAIHEDSAKTHIEYLLKTSSNPKEITNRVIANYDQDRQGNSHQFTCAAITSEYFRKSMSLVENSEKTSAILEVFFEDSPWSHVLTYMRGLQLTHSLGLRFGIRLNLVARDDSIYPGEIILCG